MGRLRDPTDQRDQHNSKVNFLDDHVKKVRINGRQSKKLRRKGAWLDRLTMKARKACPESVEGNDEAQRSRLPLRRQGDFLQSRYFLLA